MSSSLWTTDRLRHAARWIMPREPFSSGIGYAYCDTAECTWASKMDGQSLWYSLLGSGLLICVGGDPRRRNAVLWKVNRDRLEAPSLRARTTNPERESCMTIAKTVLGMCLSDRERMVVQEIIRRITERGQ